MLPRSPSAAFAIGNAGRRSSPFAGIRKRSLGQDRANHRPILCRQPPSLALIAIL